MDEAQTQVNNPMQTPERIPTKQEKTKSNFSLVLILSFTTIIATLIAGFFYFQNMQLRTELSKKIEVASTPTPTATPDETTNWKTYTDTKDKFSFKYPGDWDTLNINETTLMVAPQKDIDGVRKMVESGGGFGGGDFLIMIVSTLDEDPEIISDEYQNVKESETLLSTIKSQKYEITFLQDGPGFEKDKKHVSILTPVGTKYLKIDLLEQKYQETYDLITKSFEITN
jgi:hypothetical protein